LPAVNRIDQKGATGVFAEDTLELS
jgi:hypothetical protein